MPRAASTLHLDFCCCRTDLPQIVRCQLDICGAAGSRPGAPTGACLGSERSTAFAPGARPALSEQESLLPGRKIAEHVDHWLVGLDRLGGKAWEPAADVGGDRRSVGIDLPGEEALPKRAPGNEAYPELFASGQYFRLRFSPPQGVFALHGSDGLYRVGPTDSIRCGFR